jgi:hypothetical protein
VYVLAFGSTKSQHPSAAEIYENNNDGNALDFLTTSGINSREIASGVSFQTNEWEALDSEYLSYLYYMCLVMASILAVLCYGIWASFSTIISSQNTRRTDSGIGWTELLARISSKRWWCHGNVYCRFFSGINDKDDE